MADWAHLPTDILGTIIRKLAIPDYLRFRAVCTSWNLVCGDVCHRPRIDPWLVLPTNPIGAAKFLSVPERNSHIIHLPSTVTVVTSLWHPVSSSHGWLVYYNSSFRSMQLLNPITGAHIMLPPVNSEHVSRVALIDVGERCFTVALIYSNQNGYAVNCTGSFTWSSVETRDRLVDVMMHNGQHYTVDIYGTVKLWAKAMPRRRVWPEEKSVVHRHHLGHPVLLDRLVETPAGDLMRVKRESRAMFSVRILDEGTFTWVKADNIGDMAVFASHISTVCFPVAGHPGVRANCVYYLDCSKKLCTFDLEHKRKELVEDLGTALLGWGREAHLWFIPSL